MAERSLLIRGNITVKLERPNSDHHAHVSATAKSKTVLQRSQARSCSFLWEVDNFSSKIGSNEQQKQTNVFEGQREKNNTINSYSELHKVFAVGIPGLCPPPQLQKQNHGATEEVFGSDVFKLENCVRQNEIETEPENILIPQLWRLRSGDLFVFAPEMSTRWLFAFSSKISKHRERISDVCAE